MNLLLQRKSAHILLDQNKITAFIKKLSIWKSRLNDNVLDIFPILCDYVDNKPLIKAELIFFDTQQHLELLSKYFTDYFLKETFEKFDWILNPFLVAKTDLFKREEEEELAKLCQLIKL